jgi:FtsH-binding integral membrane protein
MNREPALKIVLALVGLLFLALVFPLAMFMRQEPALSMMLSLYVTLGVFLLLAIRNPVASRSLIAFTAWSSFAHAAVMGTQALRNMISHGELIGVAVLVVIGAALIALAPAKQPTEPASRRISEQIGNSLGPESRAGGNRPRRNESR